MMKGGVLSSVYNVRAEKETVHINNGYSKVQPIELGSPYNQNLEYLSVEQVLNEVSRNSKVNVTSVVLTEEMVHGEDVLIQVGYVVNKTFYILRINVRITAVE